MFLALKIPYLYLCTSVLYFINISMSNSQSLNDFFEDKSRNNISVYLDYCSKMGYEVVEQKGVLIYGYGFIDRGFPAEAYFMPGELKDKETLDEFITLKLNKREALVYELYLNQMRWRSPDLPEYLDKLENRQVVVGGRYNQTSCAVYCTILFNKFFGKSTEVPATKVLENSTILFKEKLYQIRIQQLPDGKGLPIFIK